MGTITAHLNGGPMHDKVVTLSVPDRPGGVGPAEVPRIKVAEPVGIDESLSLPEPDETYPTAEQGVRYGNYSPVAGRPGEYEWDGWEQP